MSVTTTLADAITALQNAEAADAAAIKQITTFVPTLQAQLSTMQEQLDALQAAVNPAEQATAVANIQAITDELTAQTASLIAVLPAGTVPIAPAPVTPVVVTPVADTLSGGAGNQSEGTGTQQ